MTEVELLVIGRSTMEQAFRIEDLIGKLRQLEQQHQLVLSLLTKKQVEKLSCLSGKGS